MPVHGIVLVLQQVGRRFVGEAIGHGKVRDSGFTIPPIKPRPLVAETAVHCRAPPAPCPPPHAGAGKNLPANASPVKLGGTGPREACHTCDFFSPWRKRRRHAYRLFVPRVRQEVPRQRRAVRQDRQMLAVQRTPTDSVTDQRRGSGARRDQARSPPARAASPAAPAAKPKDELSSWFDCGASRSAHRRRRSRVQTSRRRQVARRPHGTRHLPKLPSAARHGRRGVRGLWLRRAKGREARHEKRRRRRR